MSVCGLLRGIELPLAMTATARLRALTRNDKPTIRQIKSFMNTIHILVILSSEKAYE
jgi:hypothetical protein